MGSGDVMDDLTVSGPSDGTDSGGVCGAGVCRWRGRETFESRAPGGTEREATCAALRSPGGQ